MAKAKAKTQECQAKLEAKMRVNEREKKVRMVRVGEKRRELILRNNESQKVRMMQAILDKIVNAGVAGSDVNFNMSEMRKEITRVDRLERVEERRKGGNEIKGREERETGMEDVAIGWERGRERKEEKGEMK